MNRALALLLLLAACESKGALELVVAHTDGVSTVRLYIGVGAPTDQAIAPQGVAAPIAPTSWWPLDPHAGLDIREVPGSDEAVFQLEQGANGEAKLKVAILVGFDDQGSPIAAAKLDGVVIPGDSVARHLVTLTPLGAQGAVVHTWPRGDNKCVSYSDRVPMSVTSMVVDGEDPDCDNVTDPRLECATDAFGATRPATLDHVACLTAQTVFVDLGNGSGSNVQGCVLGGPTCTDGSGPEPAGRCSATRYCAPQSACAKCAPVSALACATNYYSGIFDYGNVPTRIDCAVSRGIDGQLCPAPMVVQLDNYVRSNGTKCLGPIAVSHGTGFGPTATFTDPSVVGMATLAVSGLDDNCQFSIQATATMGAMTAGAPGIAGMVAGMLENGRGFAIPITITGETGGPCPGICTAPMANANTYDLMKECLYSPVLPP